MQFFFFVNYLPKWKYCLYFFFYNFFYSSIGNKIILIEYSNIKIIVLKFKRNNDFTFLMDLLYLVTALIEVT